MRALQKAEQRSHISGAEKMTAWAENASNLSLIFSLYSLLYCLALEFSAHLPQHSSADVTGGLNKCRSDRVNLHAPVFSAQRSADSDSANSSASIKSLYAGCYMASLVLHQNPVTADIKLVNARKNKTKKTKRKKHSEAEPKNRRNNLLSTETSHEQPFTSFSPPFFLHLIP